MNRRSVLRGAVLASLLAWGATAAAQTNYPTRLIRIVSPNAAGGSADALARMIANHLGTAWSQQVIIENRPGASGLIGGEAVARAVPDGHTLEIISMTHLVTPQLMSAPYDPIKNFTAVATVAATEFVLVVHPSVPASSVSEFVTLAKARPDALNYASAGSGSPAHFATEVFNQMAGVRLHHIPYKGGGPAMADLLGGQVQVFFSPPINAIQQIRNQRIRPIAVSGERRLSVLPQVPTFSEAGLKGLDVRFWYGLIGPAGLPRGVVDKINAEVNRALGLADTREKLEGQGMEAMASTPDQFAALMVSEHAKFGRIIKAASIKLEQ